MVESIKMLQRHLKSFITVQQRFSKTTGGKIRYFKQDQEGNIRVQIEKLIIVWKYRSLSGNPTCFLESYEEEDENTE